MITILAILIGIIIGWFTKPPAILVNKVNDILRDMFPNNK
jgi:small basic protein